MIVYQPNRYWVKDIVHLTKSWTMQKIFRGVLLVGILSLAQCLLIREVFAFEPKLNSSVFSLLGIVLSILLVFRTNTAYDRWWEGRKQWGALVNNCRNLAILIHAACPPENEQERKYFATHISNFCIAFKEHLRDGAKLDELIFLPAEEQAEYEGKAHVPNHIASQIWSRLQQAYRAGVLDEGDIINLRPAWQSLLDILGACERIKKTPIPFSYNVYLKVFITAYTIMLPFGLIHDFDYYAVPLTMFIFFALMGVEMMGEEIEEPFGLDCNDLPTGTIAHTIKDNVFEIFDLRYHKTAEPELYQKIF